MIDKREARVKIHQVWDIRKNSFRKLFQFPTMLTSSIGNDYHIVLQRIVWRTKRIVHRIYQLPSNNSPKSLQLASPHNHIITKWSIIHLSHRSQTRSLLRYIIRDLERRLTKQQRNLADRPRVKESKIIRNCNWLQNQSIIAVFFAFAARRGRNDLFYYSPIGSLVSKWKWFRGGRRSAIRLRSIARALSARKSYIISWPGCDRSPRPCLVIERQ